jgi:hypothetical protein
LPVLFVRSGYLGAGATETDKSNLNATRNGNSNPIMAIPACSPEAKAGGLQGYDGLARFHSIEKSGKAVEVRDLGRTRVQDEEGSAE